MSKVKLWALCLSAVVSSVVLSGCAAFNPPTREEVMAERQAACDSGLMRVIAGCKPIVLFEAMNKQTNCLSHVVDAADFLHNERGFAWKDLHAIFGKTSGDPDGVNHAWLMVH